MDKWIIDTGEETSKEVAAFVDSNATIKEKWPSSEKDVAANLFYHPKARRIAKLKGDYPEGTYRYRKDPLRVVYYPEKSRKIIFPLEAASATDAAYKKRSKRKKSYTKRILPK